MKLRPYQPSDLNTLWRIDSQCFPPGVSYSRQEIKAFVQHRAGRAWVAEAEEGIVGFLIAMRESRKAAHIITIDVINARRRRGVGRALMDAAEEWARGENLNWIVLETAEDNIAAQRFYEARGYARLETIENYYPHGVAAWVMAKRLGPA